MKEAYDSVNTTIQRELLFWRPFVSTLLHPIIAFRKTLSKEAGHPGNQGTFLPNLVHDFERSTMLFSDIGISNTPNVMNTKTIRHL